MAPTCHAYQVGHHYLFYDTDYQIDCGPDRDLGTGLRVLREDQVDLIRR